MFADISGIAPDDAPPPDGVIAATGLRAAFERSHEPMLVADDRRRFVTANGPACQRLGLTLEDITWSTIDDFTSVGLRARLAVSWDAFLVAEADGTWWDVPGAADSLGRMTFKAIANVLPARHLLTVVSAPVQSTADVRAPLTSRERQILALLAAGLKNADVAERLVLSPETVKSHVHNAMGRLDARTRTHAVAIALVTAQIDGAGVVGWR